MRDQGTRVDRPDGIDVCVCTFRRPSVAATITSLAPQLGVGRRLVVIDNDETCSSRELVTHLCHRLGMDLTFVHAPARNISVARNAALEVSSARLLAFIDDDETAAPDWLDRLEAHLNATAADVVFGSVRAIYEEGAAAWLRKADLHSICAKVDAEGAASTGYCCNVLIRRNAIGQTRFREALGRSGGEDTVFFHELNRAGCKLVWLPDALTFEKASSQRATLSWLLRRFFRSGQTHALTVLDGGARRHREVAVAGAKAVYCAVTAACLFWSPAGWRKALVRGSLHCGAVARYAGVKPLQLY